LHVPMSPVVNLAKQMSGAPNASRIPNSFAVLHD
jgi:hypothetical protein